ncbi:leucine-rich repeat-containing protein 27 isoform X1 [Patella vulgata]|uniref:leucine-rich repeat-containing protein 27 isoform X1 n=1 Tax=Patella vulgata TaxID=6465 RepID=UPI00217FB1AD|nr:leucine-rich repeat-containing protein 27 isoform X1 [Patella vulgata]
MMEGGDAGSNDIDKSLDSMSSELDGLKLDSREGTPADRGFASCKRQEDVILKEIRKSVALGSNTLDLSNKGLLQIPEEILQMPTLEHLYLEGNELSFLPDEFFDCLPNLKWLDLRRNQLTRLPSVYLGRHQNLRNLLLEFNNLKSLPLELGLVKSLSGLNSSNNPLEFPPSEIMERGTQEILKFLYEMLQAKVSSNSYGEFDDDIPNYDELDSDQSDDDWMTGYTRDRSNLKSRDSTYQEQNPSRKDLGGPVPQSAELHRPVSYSDRKQEQFARLKKAGALGTIDSQLFRRHMLNRRRRKKKIKLANYSGNLALHSNSHKKPVKENVKNWRVNQYPEPPAHDFVDIKMAEERKMAKVKEFKERQDAILQRRRDEQLLKDWRDESKKLQQKKYIHVLHTGNIDFEDPVTKAPFAIEKDHIKVMSKEERIKADVKVAHEKIRRPISPGTKQRIEAEKTARIKELEKKIKEHSSQMLERRKQPKGSPQEEMEAAKKELAIAEELHKQLKVKRGELEYRFKAFTADITSGYSQSTRLKN